MRKTGGRNNQGKTTSRFRGGGHKQRYRLIDFRRNKDGVPARVDSIQYDPNRTARVALLHYVDGEKRYILAPAGLNKGDTVLSGADVPPTVGNCLPLSKIPLGTMVHNIEMQAGRGGALCRSAGTNATLMAREAGWAQISLPSGEIRRVPVGLPGDDWRDEQRGSHGHRASARRGGSVGWAAGRTTAARR